ncbi:MAG: HDOD domain-containing protein [Nitrospira sp. CG24E]|nr:MAG: HDOD domain-containing protein [Nitrospira sp. CG24E]
MMKQLLFVDDEPNLLDGLQRSLRPMRHEWNMTFVTSGAEALKALEQAPFDVIVSDMRMPGMDGAQLLNEVQQHYPQIVRIVLSGQSDRTRIYQSIGATHQYLAKPCESEVLKTTVKRACALRELLGNDSLRRLVTGMKQIPSQPTLYAEIKREAESKTASIEAIGAIISKDMGMTAKILQLVNSAYFGLRSTVSTAEQAVNLLGLDTVQALVLTVHVFSQFTAMHGSRFNMDRLWEVSTETGTLARAIAKAEQVPALMIDQTYAAGLLHDVGILVLAANAMKQYDAIAKTAHDQGIPQWEVERQELGVTHADVGAYLLGLWGLGDPIIEAVAFHHHPSDCVGSTFSPLTAVHVANVLQEELSCQATGRVPSQIDLVYLNTLHLTDRLPHWQEIAGTVQPGEEKEKSNG